MDFHPLISVVIPVKNGASTIGNCLKSIVEQSLANRLEIILIDSGSEDKTLDIASIYPVRIIKIDPAEFNHGLTRNLGVKAANGAFVYLTVQDAALSTSTTLEKMLKHFDDASVAAVCGDQGVPHHSDKNPVNWYRPVSTPTVTRYHFRVSDDFDLLPASTKVEVTGWDDVNAMYRKEVLVQLPFDRTDFAEDLIWANKALKKGFILVKDSSSVTWHYHHRSFRYQYNVGVTVLYYQFRECGFIPIYPRIILRVGRAAKILLTEQGLTFKDRLQWMGHNLLILAADLKAVFVLRKSISKGGIDLVEEQYRKICNTVVQGRLKNQG